MTEYSEETLDRDLRDLAHTLLNDPVTGPIIRDVGTHRNFTPDEGKAIFTFCYAAPFFARYDKTEWPNNSPHGPYFSNPWVAIAVARRVAQGDFSSVDDPAAKRMIADNKMLIENYDCYRDQKIAYSEFLPLFLEFAQAPELEQALKKFLPVYKKFGESNWDQDEVKEVYGPIVSIARQTMRRYGNMQNPNQMTTIWRVIKIIKGLDSLNEENIREEAKNYTDYVDMGA